MFAIQLDKDKPLLQPNKIVDFSVQTSLTIIRRFTSYWNIIYLCLQTMCSYNRIRVESDILILIALFA